MRADDDLDRYAVARAPVLHEVLLELGCPPFMVPGVVREALGRLRRGWARTVRDDDVDVVVLETLLDTWAARGRAPGWEERAGPVLARVAGLDEWQVADVLDGLVRRRRRRPAAKVAAAVVGLVVVAAAVTAWWPAPRHEDPDALPPASVQAAPALVDTVWYAGGLLRLRDVTVSVGSVRALAAVDDGAVYVAGTGDVVLVDAAGRRTRLGVADPSSPVVTARDGRLLAWREDAGDVVVHDLPGGDEVGRVGGDDLQPVAFDGGRLYLNDAGGSRAYTPGDSEAVRVSGLPLLDARAGARLYRVGAGRIRLEAVGGRPSYVGAGVSGRLSPEGRFALVDRGGEPVVYDLLGGQAATGTAADERTVAATLVRDGKVVVVVAVPERAADDEEFSRSSASGSWELRTCLLGEAVCSVAGVLSAAGEVPLFAR